VSNVPSTYESLSHEISRLATRWRDKPTPTLGQVNMRLNSRLISNARREYLTDMKSLLERQIAAIPAMVMA